MSFQILSFSSFCFFEIWTSQLAPLYFAGSLQSKMDSIMHFLMMIAALSLIGGNVRDNSTTTATATSSLLLLSTTTTTAEMVMATATTMTEYFDNRWLSTSLDADGYVFTFFTRTFLIRTLFQLILVKCFGYCWWHGWLWSPLSPFYTDSHNPDQTLVQPDIEEDECSSNNISWICLWCLFIQFFGLWWYVHFLCAIILPLLWLTFTFAYWLYHSLYIYIVNLRSFSVRHLSKSCCLAAMFSYRSISTTSLWWCLCRQN